jgi:hypothetical protein
MPEPTQITFSWAEITELLIKSADIHEGRWMIVPEYMINAGILASGPVSPASPGSVQEKPGVALLMNSLQLAKAPPDGPSHLIIDAAKVNPRK